MHAASVSSALARTIMLVVDDSRAMREIMKTILEGLGVGEVLLARDGEHAFRILQRSTPDLIFVDWCMAPMNGLDLVRSLRNNRDSPCPFVPIIMCTGYTEALHVTTARDAGVTEFLAKPVSAEAVARRIEEVIRRPRNFVRADRFFGPDRRRLTRVHLGSGRRSSDMPGTRADKGRP
jgi:two-component system, chemotaxis family, chemotaxis protein CheY